MIRPPSLQRAYDEFYSGDPAFVHPPDDATADQKAEWSHKIRVARETGDWSPIVKPGEMPTKFVMMPIAGNVVRRIIDQALSDKIGTAQMHQLAFRAAVIEVVNLDGAKVKRVETDNYGMLATSEITDFLDSISLFIVSELGREALERMKKIPPKS